MNHSKIWESEDLKNLNDIISDCGGSLQGNSLYNNGTKTFQIRTKLDDLRENLYNSAKRRNKILEVGFNAGHSNLLFLQANPKAEILNFDLMGHKYSYPCYEYLKSKYNISLIQGNSMKTLLEKDREVFDLIHIDGGHNKKVVFSDLVNCKKFAHKKTIMIFDDTNWETITTILEFAISCNFIKEVDYEKENFIKNKYHRIFRYTYLN